MRFGWATPEFRVGTFEELRSTGSLGLIRDIDFRGSLNEYDVFLRSAVEALEAQMTGFSQYAYTFIPPGFDYAFLNDPTFRSISLEPGAGEQILRAMRSAEFRRLLNAERNYAIYAEDRFRRVQSRSEQILMTIDAGLAD